MDYQNKYPADDPGMEMSAGARVWRVYLDEAEMFDNEMIQQYMDTIDIILVFVSPTHQNICFHAPTLRHTGRFILRGRHDVCGRKFSLSQARLCADLGIAPH